MDKDNRVTKIVEIMKQLTQHEKIEYAKVLVDKDFELFKAVLDYTYANRL